MARCVVAYTKSKGYIGWRSWDKRDIISCDVIQSEVMHICIGKSDVIIQNKNIGGGSWWVDSVVLANDDVGGGERDGVVDGGGEVDTPTPGDPHSCGVHWEETDLRWPICGDYNNISLHSYTSQLILFPLRHSNYNIIIFFTKVKTTKGRPKVGISLTIVIGDNYHSSGRGDGDVISGGPCETEREGLLRFTDQVIGQTHIHTTLALTGRKRQHFVHCHIVCWTLCIEQTLDDLVARCKWKVIGRGMLEAPKRKNQGVITQKRLQKPSQYLFWCYFPLLSICCS